MWSVLAVSEADSHSDEGRVATGGDVLATAHAAAKRGWRVIALHGVRPDGSCTCGRANCSPGNHGKHPIDTGWQNTPAMSAADVQATFEGASWNLGIATGAPSGFWVLDIDPDSGGFESARKLQDEYGQMPATVIAQTGSGGWHYWFQMPTDFEMRNRQGVVAGIDVRGTGGQVVVPPSVSAKGPYRWAVSPDDVEIAAAPAWLLDMLRPTTVAKDAVYADDVPDRSGMTDRERARLDRYTDNIVGKEIARLDECCKAATASGQGYRGPAWNSTTFEVACTLIQLANSRWNEFTTQRAYELVTQHAPRDRDFTDKVVEDRFDSAVIKVGLKARALPVDRAPQSVTTPRGNIDPFEDSSGGAWAAAAPQYPVGIGANGQGAHLAPRKWPVRSWDDLGNAARTVDHYGNRLRWVEQAKRWAIYDGGRWMLDEAQFGRALVQDMIEALPKTEALEHAEQPTDDDEPTRAAFLKWVKSQRMSARISACITESAGRRELQATITAFDSRPLIIGDRRIEGEFLLNVANGVIDLTTGQLHPHDPDLLLMQQSPVVYDPDAKAPRWEQFLAEMMPNPDMRSYLQRITGYSLTGKINEQAMFIHHGSGANGKSVYLQVASALTGLYGQVIPRETLLTKHAGGSEHPTSVARMVGKRFLQASETAAGRRLDEETVKGLTGGEQQPARFMGKDFFDFTPTGKIHFITNHLPRLTDAESIWRRLHFIGWRVVIDPAKKDKYLADKIIATELPGVLAWAVRGAVEWNQSGLQAPAIAQLHLAEYREEQDEFGDFLTECISPEEGSFVSQSDVYGAYQAWANRAGIRNVMKRQDFVQTLKDRGFEKHRKTTARGFLGLRVNDYGRSPATGIIDDTKTVIVDPFEQ